MARTALSVSKGPAPAFLEDEKMKLVKVIFVLPIPHLPIANRVAKPKQHDSYRRGQHDKIPRLIAR